MSTVTVPREGLTLQRFLALFLFAGAFFFGIGTLVAAAKVISGDMRAIGMFVGIGLPTWILVWLGVVLWSGRRIPKWFIASFCLLLVAVPVVAVLFSGTWMEGLAILGMSIPGAVGFRSVLRSYPGTPPKPKPFDEL